jgi:hypothetical protein
MLEPMASSSRSDIYVKMAVCVAAIACFATFTWFGNGDSDFGALTTFSMFAIAIAASARWDLRRRWYYWAVLAVVSAAHIAFVVNTKIVLPKPTIIAAPFVFFDFFLIVFLLIATDRMMRSKDV